MDTTDVAASSQDPAPETTGEAAEAAKKDVDLEVIAWEPVFVRCSRCREHIKGRIERNHVIDEPGQLVIGTQGFVFMSFATQRHFRPTEVVLCIPCVRGERRSNLVTPFGAIVP